MQCVFDSMRDLLLVNIILFESLESFRTPRTTHDWLHALRALSPLCARHPQIFAATMERVTRKQKDQIIVLPMTPIDPSCKQWAACSPIKQVCRRFQLLFVNSSFSNDIFQNMIWELN